MTPERWEQIEGLYCRTLELDPSQHATFLDEACEGDRELRREIDLLLAAREGVERTEDFLKQPALEVAVQAMAEDQSRSRVGQQVGRYQIRSLLGRGGMGEVYLAIDLKMKRDVALKFLLPEFTQDRERVRRFEQEARAISALNHPNIITIFEIDQDDGGHFIATEFVAGVTLRERLKTAGMRLPEAIETSVQVASALAAAHAARIMHRDIKPENIMLRSDGIIKVLDFGLAKLIEPLRAEQTGLIEGDVPIGEQLRTDPGMRMGTPRYMSPEQVCGQKVDGRSDVFSLGVVLYEMAAGRAPFEGDSPGDVIAAILKQEPPPLHRYTPEAPDELDRIVHKALAKDRDDRYQTVKNMLDDLESLKLEMDWANKRKQKGSASVPDEAGERRPVAADTSSTMQFSHFAPAADVHTKLPPVGGVEPLDSKFYIVRPTDEEFHAAIMRRDSTVLIKGPRQVGKTSLLARGLQQARAARTKVVLTDLQTLNAANLVSVEAFYLALVDRIADQLDLDVAPDRVWEARRGPNDNFERFVRREVLGKTSSPLVWGLDEADRLFTCDFGNDVFGLFRSWHNARSLYPDGPWQRLTMAIAYATEAHLFITDMNQSPFNIGTRLTLEDFTSEQVAELNRHYGSPLKDGAEMERYYSLVSGHPYLVRRGLQEMVTHKRDLAALEAIADHDDGPFGDHLRRLAAALKKDPELSEVVRGILQGRPCPTQESFYRLHSAGVIAGDSAHDARLRCRLYATYLETRLS